MTVLETKSDMRMKFFDMLFGDQKGVLCLATTDPRAPKATFKQTFFNWPVDNKRAEEFIRKVEHDHNVYFCINLLETSQRKKEKCLPTKLVWADLDEIDPNRLRKIPPPILLRSSPGRWQAIWRLTTPLEPFQAEEYSRRIAYFVGADKSGWDLTQLLRVPFTVNFKYQPAVLVELERILQTEAKPLVFETLPPSLEYVADPPPETEEGITPSQIIYKYRQKLESTGFFSWYTREPDVGDDWSAILWRLIHECYRAHMQPEEIFIVCREAKCNKYSRDGRPIEHLWRDIRKAGEAYHVFVPEDLLAMPELVEEKYSETIIDEYREWAMQITDAVPAFHELGITIGLSAIVSNSVRLDSSSGYITPNLWGLILGESTLTRKTTAMRLITDFLTELDNELVVASDGSPEGLLSAVGDRPFKTSVYYKDEVSGFFDAMNKKDYLAGFQETLTSLYDVPSLYIRKLRKESITLESPAFIFFGGGVQNRTYSVLNETFVLSGFLPRFLVIIGESDLKNFKPLGPPTEANTVGKEVIFNKLMDVAENYTGSVVQKIGNQQVAMPLKITAKMTDDAWARATEYEILLMKTADKSPIADLAFPTLARLSRSLVKVATILGAARQKPMNGAITIEEGDVLNAAWYIQQWGKDSIKLCINAGKGADERLLDGVLKFIENNPGITRSAIMRRFRFNPQIATVVLNTLEERGLVRSEKRGRATHYWIV